MQCGRLSRRRWSKMFHWFFSGLNWHRNKIRSGLLFFFFFFWLVAPPDLPVFYLQKPKRVSQKDFWLILENPLAANLETPFPVVHKEKAPFLQSALPWKVLVPSLVRLHRYPTSSLYLEDYTTLLVKVGKTMGNAILMLEYQKQSSKGSLRN